MNFKSIIGFPTSFLLLFVLSYQQGFSQNQKLIDSLKRVLLRQTPEKKFETLSTIGFEYRNSLQDSTFLYCNQALDLGKKIKIKSGLAKPLNFIGLAYTNKGDYKNAIDYYYQSIEISSQQNDSIQLAHSYNNLGRAFYDIGDLTKAYENFILSKAIFEKQKDKGGLAYVYRSLANIYKSQNNNGEALEMSARALELRKQLKDNRTLASAYMEIGLLYQRMNNFGLSLEKLRLADSVASLVNDKVTKAEIKLGIAENLFKLTRVDSAFQIATQVLSSIQTGKNIKLFLRSSMLIARYHLLKKNYTNALVILIDIESDSSGFGLATFQRDAAFLLMDYYHKKNNKSALEKYTNRFNFFNTKLENTDLKRQVDQLKFSVELEKKEKENRLLKLNQEQSRVLILKQRNENAFLLVLAIVIGISSFIFWVFSRKRKRDNFRLELQNQEIIRQREEIKKQNDSLSKTNIELSDLNHEKNMLMSIVAHDLKSPMNRIFALSRILEMEGGLTNDQLNYLKLVKETTNSGIDLITDLLDVTALEESSLNAAIAPVNLQELVRTKAELLQTAAAAKNITISIQNEVTKEINTDRDYLGRILDNLVSNAIKFSAANSHVFTKLWVEKSSLMLAVKDEGPGFSDYDKRNLYQKFKKLTARPTGGESSNGLGLAIVKTLVDRLNGQIELISEVGTGSEFIVKIPII
jgi:signal transduction histidine kinase